MSKSKIWACRVYDAENRLVAISIVRSRSARAVDAMHWEGITRHFPGADESTWSYQPCPDYGNPVGFHVVVDAGLSWGQWAEIDRLHVRLSEVA